MHFWLTFIFFNWMFFPMHILGVGGQMRRIYNPTQYEFLQPCSTGTCSSRRRAMLGASQISSSINFFWILFGGHARRR